MNNFTIKSSPDTKREFYAQSEIAETYDELRFGGPSGAWVNARELEIVLSLLPPFRRALDLGCGTGRLSRVLAQRGTTIGVDSSYAMLEQAHIDNPAALTQANAFAIPCASASFDAAIALRVVFHFADLETLLCEMARVVTLYGVIVFDTYVWSPRAWLPLDPTRWGSSIFVHSPSQIEHTAQKLGLRVAQSEFCFLFSPYLYRRLPLTLIRALVHLERKLPRRMRARVFWKLEKTKI